MSIPVQNRWIPLLAVVLGVAVLVSLGRWQANKGDALEAVLKQRAERAGHGPIVVSGAPVDPAAVQDMPVRVRGTYDAAHQFFLDNRQEAGQAGVHVITPLKIEGSETYILINRGWVGWSLGRSVLPVVPTPSGTVEVVGRGEVPSTKRFWLMPDREDLNPKLWSRIDLTRAARDFGWVFQPIVIQQTGGDAPDRLVRHWLPPDDRVAQHRGYAFQWYGMAIALVVFYAVALWRKRASS
ncbi:MAG: SURF1 family protein [Rhodoferax sp.]